MELSNLRPAEGSRQSDNFRKGRGHGSGNGNTAGRGHKGQNARSGGGVRPGFEGGQMPIYRRLPKRGFNNIFAKKYTEINVSDLNKFEDGTVVDATLLKETGVISKILDGVVVLGRGELTKKITVKQSGSVDVPVTEELLYSDNFDGKEATKEYGSGSSWPYIDQFPEFANPEGPAAENVTYSGSGVSVRANSTSNSSYSDYAGSGSNNIFFGGGAYFVINNIAPLKEGHNQYKLTFGTEKYTQDGDSTFKNSEFIVSLSKDGEKWAPIEYTFAGTEPGRWNVATANFALATVPEALYIKFEAKVASVYRIDDVKLYVGNGGQSVDLDNIVVEEPERPTTDALYYENFDGKGATKDSSGYWPYIADFPEMVNAAGDAAADRTGSVQQEAGPLAGHRSAGHLPGLRCLPVCPVIFPGHNLKIPVRKNRDLFTVQTRRKPPYTIL